MTCLQAFGRRPEMLLPPLQLGFCELRCVCGGVRGAGWNQQTWLIQMQFRSSLSSILGLRKPQTL